jgi:hypothetical protein
VAQTRTHTHTHTHTQVAQTRTHTHTHTHTQVAQKLVEAGKRVVVRDRIAVIHEVMKEVSLDLVLV